MQRVLLERLTTLLASQLGSHVAVAVTSLGALGLLMEILGEIEAEEMERVENAVGDKLIQTSSPLRRQVCFPAVLHMPPNDCISSILLLTLSYFEENKQGGGRSPLSLLCVRCNSNTLKGKGRGIGRGEGWGRESKIGLLLVISSWCFAGQAAVHGILYMSEYLMGS